MNVITAMGDEKLNILLRKEENINVIGYDVQYQEGIFEILEKNKINIDYLILNINLIGNFNYEDLIYKIREKNKNINLIIFLEKENEVIKNYLLKNNIKYIFNKNNFNIENIFNILNNKNQINLINEKNNINIKDNKIKNIFKIINIKKTIKNKLNNILLIKINKIKNLYYKKIINKIKLLFNLKNNNYKIYIFLKIRIKNKNKKINKKIKLTKYKNEKLNKIEKEIIKIIKEVF